jgi:two-component system OmpR family response regulator
LAVLSRDSSPVIIHFKRESASKKSLCNRSFLVWAFAILTPEGSVPPAESSSYLKAAPAKFVAMILYDGVMVDAATMRLLVVEDEPDLRRTLLRSLREEGYAVDSAEDGAEGLYKAGEWDYDAIVLDIMLPGKDGWEVLRELRLSKHTPVLVLTARDSSRDRVRGLDLGCDDYMVKPFDLPELLARLRALIRRAAGTSRTLIHIGEVAIDTARKTVHAQGALVDLTAREYALVEMLALRPGKVVTRTELYDHLFAEDDESFSNLLDVHVCNVRKKIGKDFIKTRRGHGYVIGD